VRRSAKAIGERGSWFASVDGERLPCVHRHWINGTTHLDPCLDLTNSKFVELVDGIRESGKIVLTNDEVTGDPDTDEGMTFVRSGYIAVFSVDNLTTDNGGLQFELKERLLDLR
jgi:hypothetical protein